MRRVNYDEPIKNLPDAFEKDKDSNNYKLLQIQKKSSDKILQVLQDMLDAFNIDNAYGATLDLWFGEKFGLKRGQMSDEQYRIRLKGKQMQNTTDGSFPKLVKALAFILQCDKKDIHIVASERTNSIIVKDLPIDIMRNAGFTINQINEQIIQLLSVGVYVSEFAYTHDVIKSDIYTGAKVVGIKRTLPKVEAAEIPRESEVLSGVAIGVKVAGIKRTLPKAEAMQYNTYEDIKQYSNDEIKDKTYLELLYKQED